jgi:hypothetical protein
LRFSHKTKKDYQKIDFAYRLEDIPVIGLATPVCNGRDFEGMEVFGREREAELRKFLELPNGT